MRLLYRHPSISKHLKKNGKRTALQEMIAILACRGCWPLLRLPIQHPTPLAKRDDKNTFFLPSPRTKSVHERTSRKTERKQAPKDIRTPLFSMPAHASLHPKK
ncbi:unnamed protein product [Ectocarpus sp. 13 AM-2016]